MYLWDDDNDFGCPHVALEKEKKWNSFLQNTLKISEIFFYFKKNTSFRNTYNSQGWATEITFWSVETA